MKITLRLFSVARELAGFREQTMEVPTGSCAGHVIDILQTRNPKFADWRQAIRVAVNQEYVSSDHPLHDGDEVAVIPPVSGG
jgi:molybdopterin converting factor subunit 1